MDPVSHVILGRTIVAALQKTDGSRFGRGAGAAAILGALSPDADCVLMPFGWDIYLRFHEVGTHSLAGSLLIGCAAAALVRVFVRGSRMVALAAAGSIGAVSHLALDLLSGARLGLTWPISDTRYSWPLVAMAEPWLIALLTAGAAGLWMGRRHLPRSALVVLTAVALYFGVKATLYAGVRRIADTDARLAHAGPRMIEARWGSWTTWSVSEKSPQFLRTWEVDGWTGSLRLLLSGPVQPDTPLVAASRSLETVRNFLSVHALNFAVERPEGNGNRTVLWSDVRYCTQMIPVKGEIDCGLWFGGTFDEQGRALKQEVHVGGWNQTRPVSP